MSDEDDEALLLREMDELSNENEQLQQRIRDLEQELYGEASAGEVAEFKAEIDNLQKENDELREALEAANESGGGSADDLAQMEQQLQTTKEDLEGKQVEIVRLQSTISNLESEKEDLAQKLHTEQDKARKKAKAAATSGKDTKQHKRELNRTLNENVELRAEIQDLEMDRDKLIGAVEELHEEVQESRKKMSTLQEEKDDAVKREEIKAEEIRAVRHELEETQNERQVLEQIQGLHEIALEEIQQRHDVATADIRRRLEHETRETARLTQENERLRDNTQVGALQIQLNKAKDQLGQSNEEVAQLKTQIDAAGEELTKVVQEYIMLEDDFNERVNEKVLDERKFIKALEQRLEQEKQATENAREDLSKMADDKAEVERLLNDADAKNARYERKEGLEEAVAHQKELKLEIRRRDRELSKVNHKLSEQLEANDLLTETLRRLKVEYNLPPDFEYPDLELREGIRSESERLKALNLMWEEQNSELESERMRLLQALRTQSQLSSEKGFKQFGLNAEQIQQLNYFAHQLKEGNAAEHIVLPEGPKMRKLVRENEQLKGQINRLEAKLDLMHERVPMARTGNVAASSAAMDIEDMEDDGEYDEKEDDNEGAKDKPSRRRKQRRRPKQRRDDGGDSESTGDDDDDNYDGGSRAKKMSSLTAENNELRRENDLLKEQTRLKEELPKIIQDQLRDFRSALSVAAGSGSGANAGVGQQQVDHVQTQAMLQLERKLARLEEKQEETQRAAALGVANIAQSKAKLETSMRDLEASMHERVSSPRGRGTQSGNDDGASDRAAKDAISEVVSKLHAAEMAKEEEMRANQALKARVEQLNQELQMTQQFMRQQQMQQQTQPAQNSSQQFPQVQRAVKAVPADGVRRREGGRAGARPTQAQMHHAETSQSMPAHREFQTWRQQSQQQLMQSQQQQQQGAGFGTMGPAEMMMGESFGPGGVMLEATMGSPSRSPQRYQAPKSPSARIMQARQVAALQLPPEDWADELAGINGQLIESLEELAAREDEITTLTDELSSTKAVLRDVHAKETLLYREHIAQQKAFEGEIAKLRSAVDEATAERDQAAVKAARLDQLVSVLESEEGEGDPMARLRDTVRELTRRVAVFEVNQAIMSRKYTLLDKSDKELRKNHEELQRDHTEMLRTLKLRVLYLELWRRGGQAAIEEQQRLLDDMVPKGEYHKAMRQLDTVKERFRDLLVHEAELRSARAMEQDMPRKLQEAVLELRNREIELRQNNKQRNLAVQEAQRLQRLLDDRARMQSSTAGAGTRSDTNALISQNDKLVALVAKYKGKAEQLNVLMEGKDGNCRTYKHQLEQCQNRADALTKENIALTDKLQSQRAATQRAQDESRAVSDRWEGGATKEERKALEDSLAQREALYAGLAREAEQARVHADIASEQVSSMTGVRNSEKAELENLRETVLELGSRSDDDTIIGKLTLELSQMKVSYQQFVRKYESVRAELRKSHLMVQKLEQQLDSKDAMLQETRMKSRVRILAAEKALLQLKDDVHPSKMGGAGSIVSQLESLNQKIRSLTTKGEESSAALLDAEKARIKLEGVLQEKEEEYQRTQEQLNDFRMFVKRGGGGGGAAARGDEDAGDSMLEGGDGTEPDFLRGERSASTGRANHHRLESHGRDVARRLLALSEELKAAKLRVLRQDRELKLIKDEARNLQRQVKRDDEIQRKLEEDLVQAQTVIREKELQALREAEMDMQGTMGGRFARDEMNDMVGDDDEFNGSTLGLSLMMGTIPGQKTNARNRTGRRTVLPAWAEEDDGSADGIVPGSPSTPAGAADEGTIRRMESDNKMIAKQMRRIAQLESDLRGMQAQLEKERQRAEKKDQKAELYSKQLRSEGLPVLGASIDNTGRNRGGAFGEAPLGSSSPGTPGTMQARGQFYAGEANRLQHAARQTIAQLRSMLDKKSRLVEEYKRKLTELRKRGSIERQQDQEEIRRLTDRLYEENRVAIDKLRSAFDNLEHAKMGDSGRGGGNVNLTLMECMDQMTEAAAKKDRRLTEMQGELSAKQHQLQLAEQRAGAALTELDEMRRQASHLKRIVDSQATKKLIKQLKQQLLSKEKKMSGLREAVVKLKEEYVKAQEDAEERQIEVEERAQDTIRKSTTGSLSGGTDAERARIVSGLRDKIMTLQNRMELSRKELKSTRATSEKLQRGRAAMERQIDVLKEQLNSQEETLADQLDTIKDYQRKEKDFRRREIELRDKSAAMRRQEASANNLTSSGSKVQEVGESGASMATGAIVGKLKSRVRVLETQLAAYKSDAARTERERSRLQDALSRAEAQNRRKGGGRSGGAGSKSSAPSPGSGDGESGGAHANWAAQKRLRQRADTLAKRLREKTEELEVSRKQCENAKTQLARALKDKAGLAAQMGKGGAGGNRGGGHGDKAARASSSSLSAALSQLTSVEDSRKRVYELEQRCADLTRTIEVEKEGEIRSLRAERDSLLDKKEAIDRQLASSKRRVRALEQTLKSGGGGGGGKTSERDSGAMYLRSSEERFREGEELKSELDTVTAERNVLEGRLLERDNLIMELRFDVEAATVGVPMLERRVRELETSNRALASQVIDGSRAGSTGRGSPLSASQSRKAGERFKRERDLEGVIESQNRVIMKMQTENERLTKRGVSASKIVEAQKELRSLRRRVKELSSEREELLDKAATASAARLDSGKQKDLVRQLKRKMKSTESKMSSLRETARDAQASKQRLEEELAQANTQLTKVERDVERLTTGSSARRGSGGRSERELRRVAEENDTLRSELEDMRKKLTQTQRDLRMRESERGTPGTTGGASKSSGSSREAELMDENKKLRAELESFDLEFFEEVEDLKYKYSQTREENRQLKDRIRELGGGR